MKFFPFSRKLERGEKPEDGGKDSVSKNFPGSLTGHLILAFAASHSQTSCHFPPPLGEKQKPCFSSLMGRDAGVGRSLQN
jgi:hypothetical protein